MRSLATGHWITAKQNVIITGLTGTGKSYIGAALTEAACRRGHRALCVRASRLLGELAIARANGSYAMTLARLAKLDVLLLDDLFIAPLTHLEQCNLLEVLEDRYDHRSTVVTSQDAGPPAPWHSMYGASRGRGDAACICRGCSRMSRMRQADALASGCTHAGCDSRGFGASGRSARGPSKPLRAPFGQLSLPLPKMRRV
jgi:DNA replication protein DnaC